MDMDVMDKVVFLGAVTVLSALQNVFFAYTVQNESVNQRPANTAFGRVSVANHNCIEVYPTFLALLWTAGLFCSQAPAAFAGMLYLIVRHKYFVGYLGESSQSLHGFFFGKRLIGFLFIMSTAGIVNYATNYLFGINFLFYIQTLTKASAALLLIP
ncbi:arachidonate 5-lipoxygenase-activating protein [Amblyraja radiata]|uniref:arachidonate 5-lipoxygenase-activating protein n=1 Tax=Amblyraja radiata TaxID=386614 RepID=UPI001401C9DC|nr:arachidonate 5-lipoxygenase-activating protein [Amblyraja radiata]